MVMDILRFLYPERNILLHKSSRGVPFLVDSRYGNVQTIHPFPKIVGSAGDAIEKHKYRFNWDSPIIISPHIQKLYILEEMLFLNQIIEEKLGRISPDLTTNDKTKQRSSGGTIYQDNTAAEFHCTILYLAESPVQKGLFGRELMMEIFKLL